MAITDRAFVIGLGPQKSTQGPMHLFANIVLVDTTQKLQPFLYELQSELLQEKELTAVSLQHIQISKGNFLFMGEIESVDKKKKLIRLCDGSSVSYNHLISSKGMKSFSKEQHQHNLDFQFAVQHLVAALRVRQINPLTLNTASLSHMSYWKQTTTSPSPSFPSKSPNPKIDLVSFVKDHIVPITGSGIGEILSQDAPLLTIN